MVINGGDIKIVMGQGDTDGIDSNGDIIINGGTVDVTGNSTFDYDGTGTINGGTVIVNGSEVNTLPNQFAGGGQGGMGGGGRPDGMRGAMQSGDSDTITSATPSGDGQFKGKPNGNSEGMTPPGFDGSDLPEGEFPGMPGLSGEENGERPQKPNSGNNSGSTNRPQTPRSNTGDESGKTKSGKSA